MKLLLVLSLVVLSTATPLDDEWELFKMVRNTLLYTHVAVILFYDSKVCTVSACIKTTTSSN